MKYPAWVYKHKQKGTLVARKGDNFYLYKVRSVWNREKGRAQLKTEKYLGKITPDGVVKPKHERVMEAMKHVSVKEYGASFFLNEIAGDVVSLLREHYSYRWKEVFVFAAMRLLYNTPIKNLEFHYSTSFLSEMFTDAHLSDKVVGEMLREIGLDRDSAKGFLSNFVSGVEYAAIDITHVFSLSEDVISSTVGHNAENDFTPQVNLLYLFDLKRRTPAYFRMLVGSITSVSSIRLTVSESGARNVVVIGDKGFYSSKNAGDLEREGLHYVLPLKRDSSLIDYGRMRRGTRKAFDGHFLFEERVIWHYGYSHDDGRRIVVFLDSRLKAEEEKDFIARQDGEEEEKTKMTKAKEKREDEEMEEFFSKEYTQGTIAVITDLEELEGRKIYELLKCRVSIEQLFDTFKNTLNADRTYMRDDYQLYGWMLVNFVAMLLYYKIYNLLLNNDLLGRYSPKDVLTHLARVHKLKIGDEWVTSEIPKKTRLIVEKLDLPIM
jgi:hypothetical protein